MSISLLVVSVSVGVLLGILLGWLIASSLNQKKIISAVNNAYQNATQNFQQNEEQLTHLFAGISAQVLNTNSNQYLQQTNMHLEKSLSPLKENLHRLDQQIQKVENTRIGAYQNLSGSVSELYKEIKTLQQSNTSLNMATRSLNQALRSDKSARGKWGEMQLRRIAEISGMVEHIDFDEQVHMSGDEKSIRPDMIIHMPQKGMIPVDAKAPMDAYLNACNETNPERVRHHLEQHKRALEGHIKDLSKKEYWNQKHFSSSPQLVVMFVPYESGIEASFSYDPDLLDRALENKVIIVGPSSLYALLKVISYGWMQVSLSKNTEEIYQLSKDLFRRFNVFYNHFKDIGGSLGKAVEKFNNATGSLQQKFIPALKQMSKKSGSQQDIPDEDISIDQITRNFESDAGTSRTDTSAQKSSSGTEKGKVYREQSTQNTVKTPNSVRANS